MSTYLPSSNVYEYIRLPHLGSPTLLLTRPSGRLVGHSEANLVVIPLHTAQFRDRTVVSVKSLGLI